MKQYTPQENIEYTFVFQNGAKHSFKFLAVNPAGNYIMCNTATNEPTQMTPKRFSFLYEKLLVSTRAI